MCFIIVTSRQLTQEAINAASLEGVDQKLKLLFGVTLKFSTRQVAGLYELHESAFHDSRQVHWALPGMGVWMLLR